MLRLHFTVKLQNCSELFCGLRRFTDFISPGGGEDDLLYFIEITEMAELYAVSFQHETFHQIRSL